MRFIGNKELITEEIEKLLIKKKLLNKKYKFFDAFTGSGAVSDYFKNSLNLIVNDMIEWSVVYTKGRIISSSCKFENLPFNPFEYLNSNNEILKGFFYLNYSKGGSERMYFTEENAGRIDYFRKKIEDWKNEGLISENEYSYLLASLIESISYVSNTAGVYGAFLKHWDSRAIKPIILKPVIASDSKHLETEFHNQKIEDIIENIDCDILYLDPPYTQNQYGTQYHILQTLVLNDNPSMSSITGSRPTGPMRSDWSKDIQSHILFDRVIAKTKAKHIIFSYSTDGFLSKSFIEASLKRYGKPETYCCEKISYNKYTNTKSKKSKDHFEFLFYIEKKDINDVLFESPLNYIGSKARMINDIKIHFPKKIEKFIDAFGGGFNVGINSNHEIIVYNEYNQFVKELIESFNKNDTYQYILFVKRMIKKFNLNPNDSENYIKIREHYNSLDISKRDPKLLFTIIMYGFNQQIRFNGQYDFNNPVGMRWFNDKVFEKMVSFCRTIKEKNIQFENLDYKYLINHINPNSFFYFDPPYRLTTGSYNDGKRGFLGWGIETESCFFQFVDDLNDKRINFMISYVLEHKEKTNNELIKWVNLKKYKIIEVNKIPGIQRKEILIINY
jgi:adenine-specific DNA-methyltransferase